MIGQLHSPIARIVMKIAFFIILCSVLASISYFLYFNYSNGEQQYIAKINGQGINKEAFEREVSIKLNNSLPVGDNNIELDIRRNLLLNSIGSYLLFELSKNLQLGVSDNEINKQIQHNKLFFIDGIFNHQRYVQLLSNNGFTSDVYEESLKSDFQKTQLIKAIIMSDFVLPVDLELSLLQKQKRTIYATEFSFWHLVDKNEKFTENELVSFYNSLASKYSFADDLVKLDVLKISKRQIMTQIEKNLSDSEVEAYYKKNKKKYIKPMQYSLSVVELNDKNIAQRVYNDLKKGKSFEKIVEEFSNYPIQKQSKGFIGWFTKNTLPSEMVKINSLLKNQISIPIPQNDGHYLIFKLNAIKKPIRLDYETGFPQIKYDLIQIRFDEQLEKLKLILNHLISKNISLEDIAKEVKGTIEITPWIDLKNNILSDPIIHDGIMSIISDKTKWKTLFGPIYISQDEALYVIKLNDFQKAGLMPFEKVRSDVLNALRIESARQKFHQEAENIVKVLNTEGKYDGIQFAKRFVLSRKATDFEQSVNDMVFSLIEPVNGRHYGIAYINPEVSVIATLTNVNTPTKIDDISEELLPIIIDNMKSSLIQDLYSKAKVEIIPDSKL